MATELKVGRLLDASAPLPGRDAIHVPVVPVRSAEWLAPGCKVGLCEGRVDRVESGVPPVGVVDPFLSDAVPPETPFWLFLFPGTVTDVRHVWTHPAFARPAVKAGG